MSQDHELAMTAHTVLIGYGAAGRSAAQTLPDDAVSGLVVVDTDAVRADLARREGAQPVLGDGSDITTLRAAHVPEAAHVLVAVSDDPAAVRITTTVRSLNREATIITLVRDPHWRTLATYLGADEVLAVADLVGRLLGMTVHQPDLPERVMRALEQPPDLVIGERAVRAAEIGRDAATCGPLVLAVLRRGIRLWRDHPQASRLRADDRLLVLRAAPHHEHPW
jgi:Trk K+ transport system NAD-binding subunit